MRDLGAAARRSGERNMKYDDDFGYCDDITNSELVAMTVVVAMWLEMRFERLRLHIKTAAPGR